MFVKKNFPIWGVFNFTWYHLVWLSVWGGLAVSMYELLEWKWLAIPWVPVSLLGIAVAFYIGFKNNSSYDRLWEARKIWGSIVNTSRSWGVAVRGFVGNQFRSDELPEVEIKAFHSRFLHRHITWLYVLRAQLLVPRVWEHSQIGQGVGRINKRRRNRILPPFGPFAVDEELRRCLPDEAESYDDKSNKCSQLLDRQSQDLKRMREMGLIDDFRHMELQALITQMFTEQGQCERIKNYPFPRQYASGGVYILGIFIILLPFGLIQQFDALGQGLIWLTVPFVTITGWVFIFMELIGDYSENPFEGGANDIPMKSLARAIEIDLLEMLEEDDIPRPVQPRSGFLM